MRKFEFKKPVTFSAWLTLMMMSNDVSDEDLSKHIKMTEITVVNWKANKNLPKLKALFAIIDYFSIKTGDSPTDLLDEALESMYWYRDINFKYRKRLQDEKDGTTE